MHLKSILPVLNIKPLYRYKSPNKELQRGKRKNGIISGGMGAGS